jgi:subtilisin family serine protease
MIRKSVRRRMPLYLELLEDRSVPAAGIFGPLPPGDLQPPVEPPIGPSGQPLYTSSEVMVQVQGTQGLSLLKSLISSRTDSSLNVDWGNSMHILNVNGTSLVQLGLGAGTTPKQAIAYLGTFKQVNWIEPNYIYQGSDPREYSPNDIMYAQQYHHPLMQNNLAWDISRGSPSVRIAVLDDGVAINHPDLNENIWVNPGEIPGDSIDNDNNSYIDDVNGWDTNDNDNNPNPLGSDTHGTHVAGIAAGRVDNLQGIAGVSGLSTIVPVRWYDGSTWTASMVAQSYAYGVANNIKVFNASYNFDGWVGNNTVDTALTAAYNSGALLFNSSGNNAQLNPARQVFEQVILIASTTSTDTLSSFSNYGFGTDLSAPGSGILSTVTGSSGTTFDYQFFDGTSMATPNAAGVAMLLWSQHPSWTRDQVIARMVGLADDISAQNPALALELGGGRVNSYRATRDDLFALTGPKVKRLLGLPAEGAAVNTPPTAFSLDFKNILDPSTVSLGQFELRGDGADNTFGTGDDVLVPISLPSGFSYKIGTNRFSFTINGAMTPDRYRFSALSGVGGLKDPFGTQLDGNGDNTVGDAFTRTLPSMHPALPVPSTTI